MNTFGRRYFAPEVPERLAALRVLVGLFVTVFLVVRADYVLDVSRLPSGRFEAVGPLSMLEQPLPVGVVQLGVVAAVVCAVAFTLGWRFRLTGPACAGLLLLFTTYDNSWQHIAHTENLFTLHVIVLGWAPSADAWSLDARRGRRLARDAIAYGWPVRLLSVLTVCTYVLAGWAKLRNGGMDWITGDVLRNQIAHDNVRKLLLGDVHSPIGGWLVQYGWLFPPLAIGSVCVELGAPFALLRGPTRRLWVAGAWVFHLGVLALMAILFIYPLTGIAYVSLLRPDLWVTRRRQRRSAEPSVAHAFAGS